MWIKNSKGVIVEVTEEKWQELKSHGFSTWTVVNTPTVKQTVVIEEKPEKIKPLRVPVPKEVETKEL
jgi:hypothetical protein